MSGAVKIVWGTCPKCLAPTREVLGVPTLYGRIHARTSMSRCDR